MTAPLAGSPGGELDDGTTVTTTLFVSGLTVNRSSASTYHWRPP